MSTTTTRNPIELRKAGLQALNAALGQDDTQTFLMHYSGTGDFTKERHEQPGRTLDEIVADVMRLQTERAGIIAAKNAAWHAHA